MQQNIEITNTPPLSSAVKTAKLFSTAEDLVQQGQLDQALKILNRCTLFEPKSDKIYMLRAEVYRQLRQFPMALADLNHVINLSITNPTAYIKRAEIYRTLKKNQKALLDLDQAVILEPTNSKTLGQRGIVYRLLGEFPQSLADFNEAITLDPDNAWLYGNRAEIYRSLNDYPAAINDYNQVLKLNPAAAWVYERRSYPQLWLGNLKEARSDFYKAWKVNPSDLLNGWTAEWIRMCEEDFSFSPETNQRLKSLANSNPQHYAAYLCRASLHWGNPAALKQSYNQAETSCRLKRDNFQGYFWKGMAAAGLGENEEALALMQKAWDLGIPPALVSPVNWLEKVNPGFYNEYGQLVLTNNIPKISPPTNRIADPEPGGIIDKQPAQAAQAVQVQTPAEVLGVVNNPIPRTKKTKLVLSGLAIICLLLVAGIGFALANGFTSANLQSDNPVVIQANALPATTNSMVPQWSASPVSNTQPRPIGQAGGVIMDQGGKNYSLIPGTTGYTQGLKGTGLTEETQSGSDQLGNTTGQMVATPQNVTGSSGNTPSVTDPVSKLPVALTPQIQNGKSPKAPQDTTNTPVSSTPKASPTAPVPTTRRPVDGLLPEPTNNSKITPTAQGTPVPNTVPPSNSNPAPTATPVLDPINTPLPPVIPTNTAIPVVIPTQAPTITPFPTVVPVNTPVPTTITIDTPVPTLVPTEMPTSTPIPTAVPTDTPVPTATPTQVPTETPVPTAVPTNTPVPTAVPTSTPVPTSGPTNVPPPTKRPKPTRK